MPRVSVNICCYNGEKYIAETIRSVLAQTYTDFEIIVVNDGSKDATEHIILGFKDPRIKYFAQANQGLSATRNRAMELSSGEFIAILDQDDIWEPEKLELQVRLMDSDPGVGVVYSDYSVIDEHGNITRADQKPHKYCRGHVAESILKDNYVPCPTIMFRASALGKAGKFRTDFKQAEEYDLCLRLSRICDFDFVDKPLARYRVHATNASRDIVRNYIETIACLADFAAAEQDDELRACAARWADINRLKLAAVLIWEERNSEVPTVLKSVSSGVLTRICGLGLKGLSLSPSRISRTLLWPLKAAGIMR